jgi:hypothetical protein
MKNWKKYTSRDDENAMIIHFDNTKDFLADVKKYPELRKISFITYKLKD